MDEKFTVAEFKKYIESKDSLGDVHYYLNAENIRKANITLNKVNEDNDDEEDDDSGIWYQTQNYTL